MSTSHNMKLSIGFLVFLILLLLLLIFNVSNIRLFLIKLDDGHQPFSSEVWRTDTSKRQFMVYELIVNHGVCTKKNEHELSELLGKPDGYYMSGMFVAWRLGDNRDLALLRLIDASEEQVIIISKWPLNFRDMILPYQMRCKYI